ncbi:amidase [Salinisphaera sp. LB1]|uniref:amidase n=1 Tax=Salinisphaera sp. LB1 TaxID=2183911 RepID=UPI000D706054|nr:amidase [Salinisphaera sp. LB1]AWN16460.1 Aspartyl-tRNA(Asn) amidotransferase subunit A, Glutamyl-tRNA(Gln) amidotransferase subunit A [Salinisphaera sp. LB1]
MISDAEPVLSATTARDRIASGALSCEALARQCLARIEARESEIRAWTHCDPNTVLDAARQLDRMPARGPLQGLAVGIKDIFDTHDMPTAYGSPIYAGHTPSSDAAAVALIRQAGGLVVGKTVTTEFAFFNPGKTRNPHDCQRTPGGSSSGSAAAVAAGQVPLAIGTQTAGSVIRPASFCGIVGYKPSYGWISPAGLKPAAWSLDTVGVFAADVPGAALLGSVLSGRDLRIDTASGTPPRFGFCRTPQWDAARSATRTACDTAINRVTAAGGDVETVTLPAIFDDLLAAQETIMAFEAARCLAFERDRHPRQLSERLAVLLDHGATIAAGHYEAARRRAAQCRAAFADCLADVDVLLTPSAPGEAPLATSGTGDPVFNRIWTLLGVPCVNVPGLTGPNRLPVGIQLIGSRDGDAALLRAAQWLAQAFESTPADPDRKVR